MYTGVVSFKSEFSKYKTEAVNAAPYHSDMKILFYNDSV
jgi:hypothetical protein